MEWKFLLSLCTKQLFQDLAIVFEEDKVEKALLQGAPPFNDANKNKARRYMGQHPLNSAVE